MYGASDSDLNVIQRFLDRCHKRNFTSQTVSIFNLLEQQDKSAFKRAINNHMLGAIIPKEKELQGRKLGPSELLGRVTFPFGQGKT